MTEIGNIRSGFSSKEDKLQRINDGADFVAHSLDHWRNFVGSKSVIRSVNLMKSDLHKEGWRIAQ